MEMGRFAVYPSLRGRSVVVTGGASGIGECIVEAFASQGARVAFLDVQDDAAEHLAARIEALGQARPLYTRCDLTDINALRETMAEVIAKLGAVDVLVNNAGNDLRHRIDEVTPEFWDRSLAVNLKHYFFMAQAVIPGMKAAGRGSIVNLSSISWIIPSTGLPVYVTAKAAIVGLTRTLAHELGGDGVRVNAVLPGAIATEKQKQMWYTDAYKAEVMANQAMKRMITPDEVARLVLFLAADDSSAITNQSYVVDGGWV
jgi:D-xylose 1-dehydrogenase